MTTRDRIRMAMTMATATAMAMAMAMATVCLGLGKHEHQTRGKARAQRVPESATRARIQTLVCQRRPALHLGRISDRISIMGSRAKRW